MFFPFPFFFPPFFLSSFFFVVQIQVELLCFLSFFLYVGLLLVYVMCVFCFACGVSLATLFQVKRGFRSWSTWYLFVDAQVAFPSGVYFLVYSSHFLAGNLAAFVVKRQAT